MAAFDDLPINHCFLVNVGMEVGDIVKDFDGYTPARDHVFGFHDSTERSTPDLSAHAVCSIYRFTSSCSGCVKRGLTTLVDDIRCTNFVNTDKNKCQNAERPHHLMNTLTVPCFVNSYRLQRELAGHSPPHESRRRQSSSLIE